MFTVKLATGKTFVATAVTERYSNNMGGNGYEKFLTFEDSATTHDLEWYRDLLEEEGALDTIKVSVDEDPASMTCTDYTVINDISLRLLPTGGRSVNIVLMAPRRVEV